LRFFLPFLLACQPQWLYAPWRENRDLVLQHYRHGLGSDAIGRYGNGDIAGEIIASDMMRFHGRSLPPRTGLL
jgi:hypothetical protein